ncbi:MAG: organic solvent tolerance protein OstA [Methylocystis sp.]|nr:organic solvent tolerance protein OstA [Methylocystis sp.]MBI3275429.1 organic solvent tolerance protein OstA [Methylocystis sp.]
MRARLRDRIGVLAKLAARGGREALLASLLAFALASPLAAKGARSGGILPGASAKDPLNIDAGKLDYFDKEQRLVYSGSVVVTNGPATLKASRLVIFLDPKKQGGDENDNDRVKHIDAEGPVTLVSKDQTGTGDKGTYDRAENKVYLTGNVTLSQGENVTKGEKLVYDIATGQAAVQGERVRSLFTPGGVRQ